MKSDGMKRAIILIPYAIIVYFVITNIIFVVNCIKYLLDILSPLFIGIGIAFVLNLIMRFYEACILDKLFELKKFKKIKKAKRLISVILTYISTALIITVIINFIIPQIASSIKMLTRSLPDYLMQISVYFNGFTNNYDITKEIWLQLVNNIDTVITNARQLINVALPQLLNLTLDLTMGVVNIFLGIVFSAYMLYSKEKLIKIFRKIIYVCFNKNTALRIESVFGSANKIFRSFVGGQLVESVILGVLCFIGMNIFKMPYAPLISVIVGVTSLVPILGTYVGIAISTLLILFESAVIAFWFLVFIIVLQQIEGNLIYPRVVGNAIGLNGIWVLFAVTVGGGLFGVIGILLGVPVLAVLYSLIGDFVNNKLKTMEIDVK